MTETTDRLRLEVRRGETSQELEAEIELAADPEAVWAALTQAEELMNWFPLQAEVRPGEGGVIHISWDGSWESDMDIEVWEPGRHLRTSWPWTAEEGRADQPSSVVLDYYIEARQGGGTVLRLVHSGFPVGDEWEDIFDSTRKGWSYELRSLRHYLENHRGVQRTVARVRRAMEGLSNQLVWDRLWSGSGLLAAGSIEPIETGAEYSFTMPGGLELSGRILVGFPPTDLGATVAGIDNSLFRVTVGYEGGPTEPPEVQLWLATWGVLREEIDRVESVWQGVLDRILGA